MLRENVYVDHIMEFGNFCVGCFDVRVIIRFNDRFKQTAKATCYTQVNEHSLDFDILDNVATTVFRSK